MPRRPIRSSSSEEEEVASPPLLMIFFWMRVVVRSVKIESEESTVKTIFHEP